MFPAIEDERREFVGQRRIVVEVEGFKVTPPHRSPLLMEAVCVDQTINSIIEGGGADRDDLLPVALAVGAFPDAPPDRVAVAAGASGGGDLPGLGELGLQAPGRRRAADDLLESLV